MVNVNYPRREFWELASNYNLKVLYGLDAHYRGQIQKWNELIILANEMIGEETINKLTDEMLNYAAAMEFEKAAELRDKIKELEKLLEN